MINKTILVVDDRRFDRQFLSKALKNKIGCAIVEAGSAQEALKALLSGSIDMVISDVEMPDVSVEQLVVEIRRTHPPERLPIIMVSGKLHDSIIIQCIKSGANDYITKPVNVEVAMARILSHLRLSDAIADRARAQELAAPKCHDRLLQS